MSFASLPRLRGTALPERPPRAGRAGAVTSLPASVTFVHEVTAGGRLRRAAGGRGARWSDARRGARAARAGCGPREMALLRPAGCASPSRRLRHPDARAARGVRRPRGRCSPAPATAGGPSSARVRRARARTTRGELTAAAMRELSTQTVVFTDLVGSTAQRAAVGRRRRRCAAAPPRRAGAAVVGGRHGRVVKSLGRRGHGLLPLGRRRRRGAVRCSRRWRARRAAAAGRAAADCGIGISAGDVQEVGGTCSAHRSSRPRGCAPPPRAARSSRRARPAARARRTSAAFEPLGRPGAAGAADPRTCCRVLWERRNWERAAAVACPARLRSRRPTSGARTCSRSCSCPGRRRAGVAHCAVLLGGGPGIGKTRTAAELARRVHADGGVVPLRALRRGSGGAVPALRRGPDRLRARPSATARAGRLPGELRRLVPEIATLVPGVGAPVETDRPF
jgi:hypothetical protein